MIIFYFYHTALIVIIYVGNISVHLSIDGCSVKENRVDINSTSEGWY